jgi:hypothetical protein
MFKHLIVYFFITLSQGCSYLNNRFHDASDIINISGGYGLGASAQGGPLIAGLYGGSDITGIRSGTAFFSTEHDNGQLTTTAMNIKFFYSNESQNSNIKLRGKDINAFGPFITPNGSMAHSHVSNNPAHYTQIEAVAGLGLSIRLGFNPGELLDFLLGFAAIDIFNDDIAGKTTDPHPIEKE